MTQTILIGAPVDSGQRRPGCLMGPAAYRVAGLARMIYWPAEDGPGFRFAVESRNRKGWNRFMLHNYRPQAVSCWTVSRWTRCGARISATTWRWCRRTR